MNLLKDYETQEKIGGLCFDTTFNNTGTKKGSLFRIANNLDIYPLFLACRYHISELKIVHFCNAVTQRKTSGQENPLFKKLKDMFETPNFHYDTNDAKRFFCERKCYPVCCS